MINLGWRNLVYERTRLAISVGGVSLSVLLILVMSGVFAGSEEHAVAYIKNQPVPLWIMQSGVSNMHMSSSSLPSDALEKTKAVPGVQEAVGLLYANAGVDVGNTVIYSYIFAVEDDVPFGGPWEMVEGATNLERSEVIIDQDLAARYGLELGDKVNILGSDLIIAGLSKGTFGIATSISFINKELLAGMMGVSPKAASYILVQPEPGLNPDILSDNLFEAVPGINVMTQADFAASDQEMIHQMGVDIIKAMNMVSDVVGLLVVGLTIYTATLERTREYGVLKAIGANFTSLMKVVFTQAYISTSLGFIAGVVLSYAISSLVSAFLPEMLILIRTENILQQIPVLIGITALAALLPLGRVAHLDPMVVFKAQ